MKRTRYLGYLICKRGVILIVLFLATSALVGQDLSQQEINYREGEISISELARIVVAKTGIQMFVPPEYRDLSVPALQSTTKLDSILTQLLQPHGLGVLYHRDRIIAVLPRSELEGSYTAAYYQAFEESLVADQQQSSEQIVIGKIDDINLTGESLITGKVIDAESGEAIIGATIRVEESDLGTASDENGDYTLSLRAGNYVLVFQYVGYQQKRAPIKVISSGTLDLELGKSTILLDEVVVQAKAQDVNVQGNQVGVTRISTREIEKLPSFLGEVDVIKGLLLQPGVSTLGEGASGFNVRGGNVDQNLIMIDEGIIFNASHALGFFSSFNSDIVNEAVLYKGTMPAGYGGRLASVLDVKVRDGALDRWHVKGGVGPVSSRFTIDGPITKKTSILLSARSTYSNWLLDRVNVPEVKASSAYFYDGNFRLSHRFDERNNITMSGYLTRDQFSYNNDFGFNYGTAMGQFQYRRRIGRLMLATTNLVWSQYDSRQDDLAGIDASEYQTGLQYLKAKQNLSYLADDFELNAGASMIKYDVDGNSIVPSGELSLQTPEFKQVEAGVEWGGYIDMSWNLSPRFSLIGGLRWSLFQFLGPFDTYRYADPENPTLDGLLEPVRIDDRVVKSFNHPQPRLSFRYTVGPNSSIKGGYGRTAQYINQIFNSETPTPTNFWQLSNEHITPQLAHNFSLGYFQNFNENLWVTSLEAFYRNMDQIYDYRGFADLLVNDHLETELLNGIGRAYGAELSINRRVGYVHGWFNYTYSRSERKVEGINDAQWYPSNFDKPHDLNLITNIQINKRNSISFSFTYTSGRPITVPVSKYVVQGRVVVLNYSDRNAFRIPDYHRLDLSYTLAQGFRKSRKFKTSWTFSVYNLYGRRNAYSVFVEQEGVGNTRIQKLAVLGSAFPSLTFNFELL